jgi:hypothetical protein
MSGRHSLPPNRASYNAEAAKLVASDLWNSARRTCRNTERCHARSPPNRFAFKRGLKIASVLANKPGFHRLLLVLEDRHCSLHSTEAELVIETLFTWLGIQDDLAVTGGELNQLFDD